MKITFKIDTDRKLIVVRFTGAIVYDDIIQWFNEAHGHPDFSPKYPGVVDLRNASFGIENRNNSIKMTEKAQALSAYMTKINFTTAKWAILADTPIETALMVIYSDDASKKHPIEIFSTVEAAQNFLGVPIAGVL